MKNALFISVLIPIAALLLAPAVTLVARGAALRAARHDPAQAWFGYWRCMRLAVWGTWLVCFPVAIGFRPFDAFGAMIGVPGGPLRAAFRITALILPPSFVLFACQAMSQPVLQRIRGIEANFKEHMTIALVRQCMFTIPALLLLLGPLMDRAGHGEWGMPLWFGAFISFLLSNRVLARLQNFIPHALTSGELRDKVFELAAKAGVRLQQLYVLPIGKWKMANAFATQGNSVILTDHLIKEFSKEELEAVVAHELAHLKRRHPLWLLALGLNVPLFILVTLKLTLGGKAVLFGLPLAVGFALLPFYFVSRRFEYAADATAVELTGSATAMIAALAKLGRLNFLPLSWGRAQEATLTHPSCRRRIDRIARNHHIPPADVERILENSKSRTPGFQIAETFESNPKVFSTRWKAALSAKTQLLVMFGAVILPPAVALAAHGLHDFAWTPWFAMVSGLVLVLSWFWWIADRVVVHGEAGIGDQLTRKFEARGVAIPTQSAWRVGLSPLGHLAVYENNFDWDMGFLWIDGDHLRYVGEEVDFLIHKTQITNIRLGPGSPKWWKSQRAYLEWRCGEFAGAMNLSASSSSHLEAGKLTAELMKRLLRWWQESSSSGVRGNGLRLKAPPNQEVTHVPLEKAINRSLMLFAAAVFAAMSAGVTWIWGLFDCDRQCASYALTLSAAVLLFLFVPSIIRKKATH